jgi:hypothetical protein
MNRSRKQISPQRRNQQDERDEKLWIKPETDFDFILSILCIPVKQKILPFWL